MILSLTKGNDMSKIPEFKRRTVKVQRLADKLGITLAEAENGLEVAKNEVYEALKNHPALQAQLRRN